MAGGATGRASRRYASFDENAADYKQTTLTAFQQVEDNLAALRILQQEAEQQRLRPRPRRERRRSSITAMWGASTHTCRW